MTTAEKLVKVLTEKKMTCATAESCTGGGVGNAITAVPGSSAVFWGGVISYDNSVKRDVLGVPENVLATVGAVSQECAAAMAKGVRRLLKTDLAVSLTGIAGPGGENGKPAGTVYVSVRDAHFEIVRDICIYKLCADPDRDTVRRLSAQTALEMVLELCAKSEG